MYINDLGMREEQNSNAASAVRTSAVDTRTDQAKTSKTAAGGTTGTVRFPTTLQQAVESQNVLSSAASTKIEEALDRLKSSPEWEDVGTTLEAVYKNQQQLQVQMNLLSMGYYGGASGLMSGTLYGNSSALSSLYGGTTGLLGTSIFGNMLL